MTGPVPSSEVLAGLVERVMFFADLVAGKAGRLTLDAVPWRRVSLHLSWLECAPFPRPATAFAP